MSRKLKWQDRLTSVINEWRDKPFDFQTSNCLFLAFAAIRAVNGINILHEYEKHASSERSGALALRKIDNVKTCQELLLKRLGGELQPIAFARIGDIVFIDENKFDIQIQEDLKMFGPIPGICYGYISYFVGKNGLVDIPTLQLDSALWVS